MAGNINQQAYIFGSSQPSIRHVFQATVPGSVDREAVDGWIVGRFGIAASKLEEAELAADDEICARARWIIRRALALYAELLDAANVPVHDPGRILRIESLPSEPGKIAAAITLPVVDNLPVQPFVGLFDNMVTLVCTRLSSPPPASADDPVIKTLAELVAKLGASMPMWGGSSTLYRIAHEMDVPFRHLGGGLMSLGWGVNRRMFHQDTTEGDALLTSRLCGNKWLTTRLLREAGLPGTQNEPVFDHQRAIEVAEAFGWPVVVKPADREQSRGVTVNIRDRATLVAAFDQAMTLTKRVLVERQVPGTCHRILIADGEVIYVVKRIPKSVEGNGKDPVSALIEAKNRAAMEFAPWRRPKLWPSDAEALRNLHDQGLSIDSVPEEGQRVFLRDLTSGALGGNILNLTSKIHPENVQLARETARVLGITLAGIDLITTDVEVPWYENGAAINEVNYNPEISDKFREEDARKLIPAMLRNAGRIPVYLVTGNGDLLTAARSIRAGLSGQEIPCHLTTESYSETPDGKEMHQTVNGLFERTMALTLRKDVGGIIMIGALSAVLERGLAVDRLDSVYVVDEDAHRAGETRSMVLASLPTRECRSMTV